MPNTQRRYTPSLTCQDRDNLAKDVLEMPLKKAAEKHGVGLWTAFKMLRVVETTTQ